jgi:shikimate kinase
MSAPARSLVLVGLMGAGKTTIGRRLAERLVLPFIDADDEIEKAAGCSIEEIFAERGEAAFRDGEQRVIARLLEGPVHVQATGGGAFMNPETRGRIRDRGLSIWLRADLEVLYERVSRRHHRPLLKGRDPRQVLSDLMAERYPIYGEADVVVDTDRSPHARVVSAIVEALVADGHIEPRGTKEPAP